MNFPENTPVRPLQLNEHDRPVKAVQFNHAGDFFVTVSDDRKTVLWRSSNGEMMGHYTHPKADTKTVNCLDITPDDRILVTGAWGGVCVWNIYTGDLLAFLPYPDSGGDSIKISSCGTKFVVYNNRFLSFSASIRVYSIPPAALDLSTRDPIKMDFSKPDLVITDLKAADSDAQESIRAVVADTSCVSWTPLDEYVMIGTAKGQVLFVDPATGAVDTEQTIDAHSGNDECSVLKIVWSRDFTYFCTAGYKSNEAKLWDAATHDLKQTYSIRLPCRCIAIHPKIDQLAIAGGQDAKEVTTTAATDDQFHLSFYDKIMAEKLGTLTGHFGPVHCMDFSPDGSMLVSCSEDGTVRLYQFVEPERYLHWHSM